MPGMPSLVRDNNRVYYLLDPEDTEDEEFAFVSPGPLPRKRSAATPSQVEWVIRQTKQRIIDPQSKENLEEDQDLASAIRLLRNAAEYRKMALDNSIIPGAQQSRDDANKTMKSCLRYLCLRLHKQDEDQLNPRLPERYRQFPMPRRFFKEKGCRERKYLFENKVYQRRLGKIKSTFFVRTMLILFTLAFFNSILIIPFLLGTGLGLWLVRGLGWRPPALFKWPYLLPPLWS